MDIDFPMTSWSFGLIFLDTEECTVCFEEKDVSDFPASPLSSVCNHSPSTCRDCVKSSIRSDLDAGKSCSGLACPECEGLLSPDVVLEYADDETRERYNERSMREAMEADEDFIWVGGGFSSLSLFPPPFRLGVVLTRPNVRSGDPISVLQAAATDRSTRAAPSSPS